MRTLPVAFIISLLLCPAVAVVAQEKPAALPDHYRDFAIYTSSEPDPEHSERLILALELVNRGQRHLPTRIVLDSSPKVGFQASVVNADLNPGTRATRRLTFHPPAGLNKEFITGKIYFGNTEARDLFIAVRGPDPEGWLPDAAPDVDDQSETLIITATAQVVATYAPRVRADWWRTHPSSTIAPRQRVKPLITLASRGQTNYVLVNQLPPDANQVAVNDLVRCIGIIADGAILPVVEKSPQHERAIVLRVRADQEWPHPDAYHLYTTTAGSVVIEAGHVDGVRNGIYGLLTDHLDCHWFLPFDLGEEIVQPANPSAIIGQIDERREPSFFSSNGIAGPRNRGLTNRGRMSFGHAWAGLIKGTEELYREHPEWWARDLAGNVLRFDKEGAWSFTNFCTTNPEVLDMVSQKLNQQLDHPNTIVASVDPNDYAPFCLCETCAAVDKSYGADNPAGTHSTDRMIHFANEMHKRLHPRNKHKHLGFLIYAYQIQLPASAKPADGIAGMICYMDWKYDHTRPMNDPSSPSNRKFMRLLKGWGELMPQLGFYDYPTDYVHYGPYGQVNKLREDLPLARELGVTFTTMEAQPIFAANGLNHYICGRLQWDVDADVDVLMEEFFAKYYGPAAEPMRNYWLRTEYYTATLRPGPRAQRRMTANPDMWNELDGHLKAAEQIVQNLPAKNIRFRERVQNQRDGFELGRGKWRIRQTFCKRRIGPWGDDRKARLKPNAFTPANRELLEQYAVWVADKRNQYAQAADYLPSLLPAYYMNDLEAFIERLRKNFD